MSHDMEFEELVNQHYSSLYRFAYSLTRRESDASDLTQETFFIWARKGHQVRDHKKVKSWLFTTLHREYLQKHRHISRFPQVALEDAEVELPSIPAPSPHALDRGTVLSAVARLEETFQSVLVLFYVEDYSYPEIASILGIPLGTVKSRISRGIAQLYSLLAGGSQMRKESEVARG